MEYVILALLVAVLGFLFVISKRLEEVLKEVRIPTIKRAQDMPDLKARLKNVSRPDPREAGRTDARPEAAARPQAGADRGERRPEGNRDRDGRRDRPEGNRDRDGRRDRPEGNRDRDGRRDRPEGNRDRDGRRDRPEGSRDGRRDRPATESAPAEAVAAAVETAPVIATAAPEVQQQQVGGRRPLNPSVASAPVEAVQNNQPDVLAATSLAQEAPDQPIRHGRRQLPKAKPNLDDVKLDEEAAA